MAALTGQVSESIILCFYFKKVCNIKFLQSTTYKRPLANNTCIPSVLLLRRVRNTYKEKSISSDNPQYIH